jgi:hypothetical protein
MAYRPTWWNGSGFFLVCILLAGVAVNAAIQTPNNVLGGGMMMVLAIVLAVVFKATFQSFMRRRQKRREDKQDRD